MRYIQRVLETRRYWYLLEEIMLNVKVLSLMMMSTGREVVRMIVSINRLK